MITYGEKDDDNDHDPTDYLGQLVLPPRSELWAAVREAYDYLHEWVNDSSSRVDPTEGNVDFDAYTWGERDEEGCKVCLAGLWYLRKVERLLTVKVNEDDEYENVPESYWPVCKFLDNLRHTWAFAPNIQKELGVVVPGGDEIERIIDIPKWTLHRPEDILAFLGWLLQQKDTQAMESINDS